MNLTNGIKSIKIQDQHKSSLPSFGKTREKSKATESVHHKAIRDKFLYFYENQKFSDICLVTSDEEKFHAHKCILSASSDYFLAMIGDETEMKIHEVKGEILKPILAFMYTGNIKLQRKTIDDVLRAAIFLQMKPLITECNTFMTEELDFTNCLSIAMVATQQGLTELYKDAFELACKHFDDVQKEEEFLEISEDQLCKLISEEELCVSSEEVVFFSIIKWIEHDQINRDKCAYNLFSKVRYHFLSLDLIKQHRTKLQTYQIECLELVCIWMEWHMASNNPLDAPRPKRSNELVLLSNGQKLIYNPGRNKWVCEKDLRIPQNISKALKINTKLVFLNNSGSLTCHDLRTNEKTVLPRLFDDRREFGLAVLNEELYAVGGRCPYQKNNWKCYVDKFDFASGKWQTVTALHTAFTNPRVAVAGGFLYVIGKEHGMECFEPELNEWTQKPSKNIDLLDFGFTGVNEKLYIVGGISYIKNKCAKSVFSYNPSLEQWETEKDMKIKLCDPACIPWNNQLIVFGGSDNKDDFLNIVQKYNPASKTWTFLASPDYTFKYWSFDILNF